MYKITKLPIQEKRREEIAYDYYCKGEEWMLIHLFKGSVGGKHYHTGKSSMKNPETLIITKGKAKFFLKSMRTGKEEQFVIDYPAKIEIESYVYHEIHAIEDCNFIEPTDNIEDEEVVK